jgi:hypothetical protein
MGHLIFLILHTIAIALGLWMLVFTIPFHIIYSAVRANRKHESEPSFFTHVRCPECRELVLKGAKICKHCGCSLIPQ